jgi:hypothetical protein
MHSWQVLTANCRRAKRPDGCWALIEIESGAASASTSAHNPPSGPDLADEERDERERCPSRSVGRLRCVAMLSPGAGRDLYAWVHRRDIPGLLTVGRLPLVLPSRTAVGAPSGCWPRGSAGTHFTVVPRPATRPGPPRFRPTASFHARPPRLGVDSSLSCPSDEVASTGRERRLLLGALMHV